MTSELHPARISYIVAKALHVAADHMKTWPDERRPDSDIADMRHLLDTQFAGLAASFEMMTWPIEEFERIEF